MMETLKTVGLVLLSLLVIAGIVKSFTSPWRGFLDFIIEMLWLDFLFDILGWIISAIFDNWD